jgi:hypothetical protein
MEKYRNRESKIDTPEQLTNIYKLEQSLKNFDCVLNI